MVFDVYFGLVGLVMCICYGSLFVFVLFCLFFKEKLLYESKCGRVCSEICISDFFFPGEDGKRDFWLSRWVGKVY